MIGGKRNHSAIPDQHRSLLLSIITVVYNGGDAIQTTIESVLTHSSRDVEYIIIDGQSTDGTLAVIKRFDEQIDYWVSEPDKGIYDALNKGIRAARGHFVYTLNIGDRLLELPVDELTEARQKNADVVMFDVALSNGKIFDSKIDFRIHFGNTIHHQGAFYKRSPELLYDLRFRIFADFDLNQKFFLQGKIFRKHKKIVSYHSIDGISHNKKHMNEYLAVTKANFGYLYATFGLLYIWYGNVKNGIVDFLKSR